MLSRKYYKMIAKVIKVSSNKSAFPKHLNKDSLINDLCEEFKKDNDLFNKQTFIDACNFGCDNGCDFE